jgi:tRNA dimethylallyltransferase
VPIVAGGTGLYVNALIDRWEFPPQPADMTFRERLQEEADHIGFAALHARLRAIDPATAERLHPNDVRRVTRALEVYELTGRPVSSFQYKPGEGSQPSPYRPLMYGLSVPRDILYDRLERRVHQQLEAGLLEEVRRLDEAGYSPDLTSMKGITYRQLLGYLHGQYDFSTAIELMVRDNRRYAKRQYTWFKPDPRIHWVDVTEAGGPAGVAEIVTQGWRTFAG